jgi:hypothetical protein
VQLEFDPAEDYPAPFPLAPIKQRPELEPRVTRKRKSEDTVPDPAPAPAPAPKKSKPISPTSKTPNTSHHTTTDTSPGPHSLPAKTVSLLNNVSSIKNPLYIGCVRFSSSAEGMSTLQTARLDKQLADRAIDLTANELEGRPAVFIRKLTLVRVSRETVEIPTELTHGQLDDEVRNLLLELDSIVTLSETGEHAISHVKDQ